MLAWLRSATKLIKELEGALEAEGANSREVIRELNEKLAAARDTLKVHVELSESSSEMHAKLQAEQAAALASAQQDARNALERLADLASKARVEEELHINTGIFARQFF